MTSSGKGDAGEEAAEQVLASHQVMGSSDLEKRKAKNVANGGDGGRGRGRERDKCMAQPAGELTVPGAAWESVEKGRALSLALAWLGVAGHTKTNTNAFRQPASFLFFFTFAFCCCCHFTHCPLNTHVRSHTHTQSWWLVFVAAFCMHLLTFFVVVLSFFFFASDYWVLLSSVACN